MCFCSSMEPSPITSSQTILSACQLLLYTSLSLRTGACFALQWKLASASQEAASTFASQDTAQSCKDTHRTQSNITYMSRVSVYLLLR